MDYLSHDYDDEFSPSSTRSKFDKRSKKSNEKSEKTYYNKKSLTRKVQRVVDRNIETKLSTYVAQGSITVSLTISHNNLTTINSNLISQLKTLQILRCTRPLITSVMSFTLRECVYNSISSLILTSLNVSSKSVLSNRQKEIYLQTERL